MKTKRKQNSTTLDNELSGIFQSFYEDADQSDAAVREAKRAYSFIKQDVLYHKKSNANGE